MNLPEVILKVLTENRWGMFHKTDPLEKLKVQDSQNMYRINERRIKENKYGPLR